MTAPTQTDQSFLQDVRGCSRCGGDHDSLRFARFKNLPSFLFVSHWAMCPTTSEPVLLWFEPDEDDGGDVGELPPRPPIKEPSAPPELTRYGRSPCAGPVPLLIQMADGYWTPWHIAAAMLQRQTELAALRDAKEAECPNCGYEGEMVPVPAGRRDAEAEAQQAVTESGRVAAVEICHVHKDGECHWEQCPQLRDGEPAATGRSCPLPLDLADIERAELDALRRALEARQLKAAPAAAPAPRDVDAVILRLLDMAQFMEPGAQDRWEIENAATLLRQMESQLVESQLAALRGVPVPEPSAEQTEEAAKLIYESMRFAVPDRKLTRDWVERGNSLMQDEARRTARAVLACWDHPATPPAPEPVGDLPGQDDVGELIHCLRIREQSLSQQAYSLVQLGDAAYFGRAATRLEQQEYKLAAMIQLLATQLTEPAKALVVPVNELPWNRPGWCDAEGRCWLCNAYSMGRWNYDTPPDPAQDWGRLGTVTHSAPHWAIPRPRPVPRADAGEAQC